MKKRVISIFLTLFILLGLNGSISISATESAASAVGQSEDNPVICDTYKKLSDALESEDITYVKLVTLDEESHRMPVLNYLLPAIRQTGYKQLCIEGSPTFVSHYLNNMDSLIEVRGTLDVVGTGTLTYYHNADTGSGAAFRIGEPQAKLNFLSDDVRIVADCERNKYDTIYSRSVYAVNGQLNITGGFFYGCLNDPSLDPIDEWNAVTIEEACIATISGGTFKSIVREPIGTSVLNTGLGIHRMSDGGSVTLTGGSFDGIVCDEDVTLDEYLPKINRGYTYMYSAVYYNEHTKIPLNGYDISVTPRNEYNGNMETITVLDLSDCMKYENQSPKLGEIPEGSHTVLVAKRAGFSFNTAPLPEELTSKGFYTLKQLSIEDPTISPPISTFIQNDTEEPLSYEFTFSNPGTGNVVESICIMHPDYVSYDKNGSIRTSGEVINRIDRYTVTIKDPAEFGEQLPTRIALTTDPVIAGETVTNSVDVDIDGVTATAKWYKHTDGTAVAVDVGDTFIPGTVYECRVELCADSGKYIHPNAKVSMNGEQIALYSHSITDATYSKYFYPMIKEVQITGVRPPIAGKTDISNPTYSVDDECGVTVVSKWKNADGSAFTGTFVEGETYVAYFTVNTAGGDQFLFTEDIVATVNGIEVPESNFDSNDRSFNFALEFKAVKGCSVVYGPGSGDGGIITCDSYVGERITLDENIFTAPDGMAFKAWIINGIEYLPGNNYTVAGDTSITAVWEEAYLPGDADSNGKVTLNDAAAILKYVARWEVEIDLDAAEVTGDEKVNLGDASLILKYVAKWDVEFN